MFFSLSIRNFIGYLFLFCHPHYNVSFERIKISAPWSITYISALGTVPGIKKAIKVSRITEYLLSLSTYYLLGTMLSSFHTRVHLILTMVLCAITPILKMRRLRLKERKSLA